MNKTVFFVILTLIFLFLTPFKASAQNQDTILGTRYHYPTGNSCAGVNKYRSLIPDYGNATIRGLAREQFKDMRGSGFDFIKLGLYYSHNGLSGDPTVIPSLTGKIPEPYRTNFINLMKDVKDAGFQIVQVGAGPMYENNPGATNFTAALFNENWSINADIRELAKQYGPPRVFLGLFGELNIQSDMNNPLNQYGIKMWQRYVDTYGTRDDATMYIIMQGCTADNYCPDNTRLPNYVRLFQAAGRGYPTSWGFSFYPGYDAAGNVELSTYYSLVQADNTLTSLGLTQPFFIDETWYNDPTEAKGLQRFLAQSNRKIIGISQWELRPSDRIAYPTSAQVCVWPPYSIDNYKSILPGTISCSPSSMVLPSGTRGTAVITSTTLNLGTSNAQVCVSVGGGAMTLMTTFNAASNVIQAPWIVGGNTYQFNLYKTTSGTCTGTLLASCNVTGVLPAAGDLNSDGHVNIDDFNIIKSGFSTHPYTIFDYNQVVTNFGR